MNLLKDMKGMRKMKKRIQKIVIVLFITISMISLGTQQLFAKSNYDWWMSGNGYNAVMGWNNWYGQEDRGEYIYGKTAVNDGYAPAPCLHMVAGGVVYIDSCGSQGSTIYQLTRYTSGGYPNYTTFHSDRDYRTAWNRLSGKFY